jgi:sugar (pentulose or hexulose) kinase
MRTADRWGATSRGATDGPRGRPGLASWLGASVCRPTKESFLTTLRRAIPPDDLRRIGNELRPGSASALLARLTMTGELPDRAVGAATLCDVVIANLCAAPCVTDPTCALGLLDLERLDWHHALFERLGFGGLAWPRLIRDGTSCGAIAVDGPGRGLPCWPAIGDHQASLIGVDLEPGELSINVSTGSQVSRIVERFAPRKLQVRPYPGGRMLETITHLPAGRALQGLVDLFGELARSDTPESFDPWRAIERLTREATRQGIEVDLTLHDGPTGHTGSIDGLTLENLSVGSIFAAAFEDMAARYERCALRLDPSRSWRGTVLSGGLPRRLTALRRAIEGRFADRPLRAPESAEAALEGLARFARDRLERPATAAESRSLSP